MGTINGHVTRISMSASSYDEVCVNCGAHDEIGSLGGLAKPCPAAPPIARRDIDDNVVLGEDGNEVPMAPEAIEAHINEQLRDARVIMVVGRTHEGHLVAKIHEPPSEALADYLKALHAAMVLAVEKRNRTPQ